MKETGFLHEIKKNKALYLMMILPLIFIFIFNYIPMLGITVAFRDGRTVNGFFSGEWVGLSNFKFFFKSQDAARVTFNTVFMNTIFILTGTFVSVVFALLLNELNNRKFVKLYQTVIFLPYFLSWVIMGYISYAFLSVDNGFINKALESLGLQSVQWYSNPDYWPWILMIVNLIKSVGYTTVVYYSAIVGIDKSLYESAEIDGAGKIKQMIHITVPLIRPMVMVMVLLAIGKIFHADFGMFYYIPRETGVLFPRTDVIDTYVYRSLRVLGNSGMSAAVGLFQSILGLIMVLGSNLIVKKYDSDSALF